MRKDIEVPEVKNVLVAIVREVNELNQSIWSVHLINRNGFELENTLVASKGYGQVEGAQQKTSTLRHFLETVPANGTALIEPIQEELFHLNNEYWLSYYVGGQIYDKKFTFLPESITEENLSYIKEIDKEGVLHS